MNNLNSACSQKQKWRIFNSDNVIKQNKDLTICYIKLCPLFLIRLCCNGCNGCVAMLFNLCMHSLNNVIMYKTKSNMTHHRHFKQSVSYYYLLLYLSMCQKCTRQPCFSLHNGAAIFFCLASKSSTTRG